MGVSILLRRESRTANIAKVRCSFTLQLWRRRGAQAWGHSQDLYVWKSSQEETEDASSGAASVDSFVHIKESLASSSQASSTMLPSTESS